MMCFLLYVVVLCRKCVVKSIQPIKATATEIPPTVQSENLQNCVFFVCGVVFCVTMICYMFRVEE